MLVSLAKTIESPRGILREARAYIHKGPSKALFVFLFHARVSLQSENKKQADGHNKDEDTQEQRLDKDQKKIVCIPHASPA